MPIINYRVNLADLRHMEQYEDFVGLAAYDVGDTGTVYSEELGIWTSQQIVKQVMDAITGEVQSIELGSLRCQVDLPVVLGGHKPCGRIYANMLQNRSGLQGFGLECSDRYV